MFLKLLINQYRINELESWNKAKWDIVGEQYITHLDNIVEDKKEQEEMLDKLITLCLSLCELSQAIPSRGMGARLLAILSNIVDRATAKKRGLNKLKSLCRDFNWEVRKAISGHLTKVFNLLDEEEADKHMIDIMAELLDDEENEVKNLAIEAFLTNIDRFSDQKIEDHGIEMVVDIVKNDANKELLLEKLDHFIEVSQTLRRHFSSKEYLEHDDEQLRNKIILNSPLLLKTVGEEYFIENIYSRYKNL